MILYTERDSVLYIQAKGHITAQFCTRIKERVFDRLEKTPKITAIYTDLSECTYMDSTFLGLLAGFSKKLKNISGGRLYVQNADAQCTQLLHSMGLDRIMDINTSVVPFPENMETLDGNPDITPELLLDAHEDLMELSRENTDKFSGLHHILTEQIKAKKDGGA